MNNPISYSHESQSFYENLVHEEQIFTYSHRVFNNGIEMTLNLFKEPFFDKHTKMWTLGHFIDNGEDCCEFSEENSLCILPSSGEVVATTIMPNLDTGFIPFIRDFLQIRSEDKILTDRLESNLNELLLKLTPHENKTLDR